jgi:hypothetical protein|nr:MAG TPA: hypothetical protein [Caudoviricetes sp.]
MDFEALINAVQNPGEGGVPPTIYDDIRATYQGVQDQFSSAQAKIGELTESNSTLAEQLNAMKAANYDLLTQVNAQSAPEKSEDNGGDSSDDSDDEEDDGGIDAFFEKRDDDKEDK